jgi:hypothetical protein
MLQSNFLGCSSLQSRDKKETRGRSKSVKAFLDHFAAILGAFTVGLIVVSVSHEYGYFLVIGKHFQTFLSSSDYFANAMLWMPYAAFFIYVWIDWNILKGRSHLIEKPKTWWGWVLLLSFMVGLPIAAFFYIPPTFPLIYLTTFVWLWMVLFDRVIPIPKETPDEVLRAFRQIARFGPPVVAAVFTLGLIDGNSDLKRFDDPYIFREKDSNNEVRLIILRNFANGVLVRNAVQDRIEFRNWDTITMIGRPTFEPQQQPLSCAWLHINCSYKMPIEP